MINETIVCKHTIVSFFIISIFFSCSSNYWFILASVGSYRSRRNETQKYFFENLAKKNRLTNETTVFLEKFKSIQKNRVFHFCKRRPFAIELFTIEIFEQKLFYIHNNPVAANLMWLAEKAKPRRGGVVTDHGNKKQNRLWLKCPKYNQKKPAKCL